MLVLKYFSGYWLNQLNEAIILHYYNEAIMLTYLYTKKETDFHVGDVNYRTSDFIVFVLAMTFLFDFGLSSLTNCSKQALTNHALYLIACYMGMQLLESF